MFEYRDTNMHQFKFKTEVFIVGSLVFLFSMPKFSYAYVDPGTGSYIFQIVIASFFASIFFFKSGFKKARTVLENIFTSRKNKVDAE